MGKKDQVSDILDTTSKYTGDVANTLGGSDDSGDSKHKSKKHSDDQKSAIILMLIQIWIN